mmetsp:Transcript_104372/g.164699  ORF Transcript_104372/g.164699 Transcript_104372/m.164699 type:complete len:143 (-) Transcript_104372:267-695(-)|eukprot:CAMPEP_0169110526 /NCGR_PEP_ID=MMETSP1015-20121227/26562_1 /TAXON_ID=342587 /ORGANISM="Karlodinium micrum, Strain CCMP2283" /LENGTH=142 /DNA_ID=CAMNT_0009172329 /DNA_START=102 /DNA_END=530 /DNA_ORIENTATION=-
MRVFFQTLKGKLETGLGVAASQEKRTKQLERLEDFIDLGHDLDCKTQVALEKKGLRNLYGTLRTKNKPLDGKLRDGAHQKDHGKLHESSMQAVEHMVSIQVGPSCSKKPLPIKRPASSHWQLREPHASPLWQRRLKQRTELQ